MGAWSPTARNSQDRPRRLSAISTSTDGSRIYPTKSWDNNALVQPKSRAAFSDTGRRGGRTHPRAASRKPMYTFWDYKLNRWRAMAAFASTTSSLAPP